MIESLLVLAGFVVGVFVFPVLGLVEWVMPPRSAAPRRRSPNWTAVPDSASMIANSMRCPPGTGLRVWVAWDEEEQRPVLVGGPRERRVEVTGRRRWRR